ncbi:MAG: MdtA/MuxA family multidrug efflux RND transporter periplasmic adaptor subunit [Magnetococcales bacterium]|nr:MdtA/MuxA family multidrug efflux RND transporter periplasmic adaptor subunit [Magnetococcales bacterium]
METQHHTEENDAVSRPKTRRRWWVWLVLLGVGVGAGYYGLNGNSIPWRSDKQEKGGSGGKGGHKKGNQPVPVLTATATTGTIRLQLEALGRVLPAQWVTVRTRVDGQLLRLAVQEGERVEAGQLLAEIDPRPFQIQLEQAKGQLTRDQALLDNARRDALRYQTLLKEDSVSRQQVDTQQALVQQYQGSVAVDQAQLDNAHLQLSYTRITAPITGVTGLRTVDPGNMIRQSDSAGLLSIAQTQPVHVLFTLPEDRLPALLARWQPGKTLPVALYDRERKNRLAEGKLLSLDNQIDTSTGTIKLKAEYPNSDGGLFPNQFVQVTVTLEERPGALLIPSVAIQRGRKGPHVYRVEKDQSVAVQPVQTGQEQEGMTAIEAGLQAGEQVVVEGMDKLQEGSKIQAVSPTQEKTAEKSTPPHEKGRKKEQGADRPPNQPPERANGP